MTQISYPVYIVLKSCIFENKTKALKKKNKKKKRERIGMHFLQFPVRELKNKCHGNESVLHFLYTKREHWYLYIPLCICCTIIMGKSCSS